MFELVTRARKALVDSGVLSKTFVQQRRFYREERIYSNVLLVGWQNLIPY
ncbi:MAG: hypothetical protein WA364_18110 [Candidatus Nitrosopolaris sp.]